MTWHEVDPSSHHILILFPCFLRVLRMLSTQSSDISQTYITTYDATSDEHLSSQRHDATISTKLLWVFACLHMIRRLGFIHFATKLFLNVYFKKCLLYHVISCNVQFMFMLFVIKRRFKLKPKKKKKKLSHSHRSALPTCRAGGRLPESSPVHRTFLHRIGRTKAEVPFVEK